jgi:hypothetical protein
VDKVVVKEPAGIDGLAVEVPRADKPRRRRNSRRTTLKDSSRTPWKSVYALAFFTETYSYDYTKMFAALTLIILPGIIIYAISQEQVQVSLSSGSVKG